MIYYWGSGGHEAFVNVATFDLDEARYLVEAGGGLVIAKMPTVEILEPSLVHVELLIDWVQPEWLFELDRNRKVKVLPNVAWMHLSKPTFELLVDRWTEKQTWSPKAYVTMRRVGMSHIDRLAETGGWSLAMIQQLLQAPLPWQDIHALYGVDLVTDGWEFEEGYRYEAWTPDGSETELCRTIGDVMSILEQWTGVDFWERLHGAKKHETD